ncbi:rRNA maturation RNase YbeY [Candidatus Saccharibacteria bacterium]|nr:rRNA maturation RNase YbeY [Candidatus Saccharibacteria bacterium]
MAIQYTIEGKSLLKTAQLRAVARGIEKFTTATSNGAHDGDQIVGLSFVTTKAIQKLNKHYASNDYPTDVLSFNYSDDKHNGASGDIVICEEIARSQARRHNVSLEAELTLLLLHGTLHLLGFDHQDKNQIASLDRLQSDIMEALHYKYRDFEWSH